MNPVVGEFTVCPDDKCLAPAEVVDDYAIPDSEGNPVRHRVIECVHPTKRHHYTVVDGGKPFIETS